MKVTASIFYTLFFWVLLPALLGYQAQAQPLSENNFAVLASEVEALVRAGKPQLALDQLVRAQSQQENNPEFDYLLGTTALAAESHEVAINALERVVLMQPNFAGAWLDLAIAYFQVGNIGMAGQLINHVDENFSPPASLKTQLAIVRKKINQAQFINGWHVDIGAFAGHVKNANYGLRQSSFQLTPSGYAPMEVIVTGENKPQDDDAIEVRTEAYRKFDYGNLAHSEVQLSMRAREYAQVTAQNFIDLSAYGAYTKPLIGKKDWDASSGVMLRHLMLDGKSKASYVSFFTGLKTHIQLCNVSARLELEHRNFQGSDEFNANIPWLGFGAVCPIKQASLEAYYRYGWDNPEGARPGGVTMRQESSVQLKWQANSALQMRGVVYYANYSDKKGYSELLDRGHPKEIHRLGQRLELAWILPQAKRWLMQLELDNMQNRSNIAVSDFNDTQIFVGLRYQLF